MKSDNYFSLSEKHFFVLGVININNKIHGYKIIREVEILSEGKIQIAFSSLYTMLRKFEQFGLISECERKLTGTKTIYYQITDKGRLLLENEIEKIQKLITIVALSNKDRLNDRVNESI